MTGITPENVGKHGVLAWGESRLVGKLTGVSDVDFGFRMDGTTEYASWFFAREGWSFTPDAPKARLGMIVRVSPLRSHLDDYLVRTVDGWLNLANGDLAYEGDDELAALIADPVFPGVADL